MALRQLPQATEERDRAVTVEQNTESVGSTGFPLDTWSTLATNYWCSKQDLVGKERFEQGQQSAPFATKWVGSYRADMDPELVDVPRLRRIVYQGRRYDITAASMVGMKETIQYMTIARMG
jgi:hypothetical protein